MKNYNLSFMNEYIKLKKISIYDLVGIFYVDAYKIMNYFNGLEVPPKSFLSMLYKYMEVNNYDELYNKVKNEIEKIKDENKVTSGFEKKYNIGFLSNKNIDIEDLSIYCNISKEELISYITGKKLTPIIIVNKICKYFKVNNINDLKDLEEKENNEINTFHDKRRIVNEFSFKKTKDEDNIEIIEKSLDIKNYDELKTVDNFIDPEEFISYLKLYIKNKNITLKDISDGINVNYSYISCMLNGVYTLNENYIIKILEFLNLENYDELKKIVNNLVDPEEFINYLKLYMKNKNITLKDISDGININYPYISGMLNGVYTLNEEYINKILEFLGLKKYDELKKMVDNSVVPEEFVSYLKLYIKNKNITLKDISDGINISYSHFSSILNGRRTLTEKYINKILEFLNLKNYEELKKKSNDSKKIKKFVKYLKQYLKKEKISLEELANGINISYSYLCGMLNGRCTLNEKYINKILEYLDIYNLNKLKYETEEDLTFIKPFLLLNGITQSEFAKILNCGITNANKVLNGVVKLQPMYIKNLLEYFNFTDFKSFKDYVFLILNKNNVNIVDYAAISLIFTHNDVNKMMDKLSKELNISYDLLKYNYEKYKLMYNQSINSKNNDFNIPLYKLNH